MKRRLSQDTAYQAFHFKAGDAKIVIPLTVIAGLASTIWVPAQFALLWTPLMLALVVQDLSVARSLAETAETDDNERRFGEPTLAAYAALTAVGYAVMPFMIMSEGGWSGAIAGMAILCACVMRGLESFSISRLVGFSGTVPFVVAAILAPLLALISLPGLPALAALAAVLGTIAYLFNYWNGQASLRRRLSEALTRAKSEKRLAMQLLEQPTISIGIFDSQLRFLAISPRLAQVTQVDPKAAIGKTVAEVIPWAHPAMTDLLARALQGERLSNEAQEAVQADGSVKLVSWEMHPWRDGAGEIAGVIFFGRDVTEQMRERRTLEAYANRLELALDVSKAAVYEINLRDRQIVAGEDVERVYGRRLSMADLDPRKSPQYFDEDREEIASQFRRIVAGELDSYEHRYRRLDGSAGWVALNLRVERGAEGAPERIIFMATDSTSRKERELAFAAVLAQGQDILDARRTLLAQLRADLGLAAANIPDPPRDTCNAAPSFRRMTDKLRRMVEDIAARDQALSEAVAALSAARATAETSNAAKSQFLANMSHELRTPLNAIIGYSELMLEVAEDAGRADDVADHTRVLNAGRRLLSMINEVLDLSKIEAGRMELEEAAFDVGALARDAMETVRPAGVANRNAMVLDLGDGLGEGFGDGFKISQCLLNLLSNATKFTHDGEVRLSVRRESGPDSDWLMFEVADTGIGIDGGQKARLFEPFMQADVSTTRAYGGTGLGLTITRRLVELMGGSVALESAVGQGSRFAIRLPTRAADTHATAAREQHTGPLVLVIEDDPNARDLAARALQKVGFSVAHAATGAEGLALADTRWPALVVLDLALPDMSGWDVLAALTDTGREPRAPVMIVSSDVDRARAVASGACAHLVKPASSERIAAAALQYARARPVAPVPISLPSDGDKKAAG